MQRSEFNELFNNIDEISDAEVSSLEALRIQYPYFQTLHLLLAKAYKDRDSEKQRPALHKAAIYSVDRPYLKQVLEGEHKFVEVIREEKDNSAKGLPPEQKETVADKSQLDNSEKDLPDVESQLSPKKDVNIKEEKKAEEKMDHDVYKELDDNLKLLEERKKVMAALLQEDSPVEKNKPAPIKAPSRSKKDQIELIEKFIKNEPQMEKPNRMASESDYAQEDLAKKSISHSEAFLTPTLAELMVRQRKYSKAIDIYEKLMLKFPKKTAYFASQIEKINNRSNV